MRGLLRGFGLKVGDVSRDKLPARIRELAAGHATLEKIVEPLLSAHEAMWREFAKLHREVLVIVREDQVCRRLMTAAQLQRHDYANVVLHDRPPDGQTRTARTRAITPPL